MRITRNLIIGGLAVALMAFATACGSTKKVAGIDDTADFQPQTFVRQIATTAAKRLPCISSKLKFTVSVGSKDVSVGGHLRMRRDDVIRIQLMALGLVEAGRLEFTPDYVLMMDRINKQYVKAAYDDVDFLRQSGLNFYTLQALFAGELFEPGRQSPDPADFRATRSDRLVSITLETPGVLSYQWQAEPLTALIRQTNINHGEAQVAWDYRAYKNVEKCQLPSDMEVNIKTTKKTIKAGFQLSSFSTDDDWEARTNVSSKYKQVIVDDILRRLMAL